MLIRHFAEELRRVNMDRVSKVLCVLVSVGQIGEVGDRERILVISVKCGKE